MQMCEKRVPMEYIQLALYVGLWQIEVGPGIEKAPLVERAWQRAQHAEFDKNPTGCEPGPEKGKFIFFSML